MRSPGPFAVDTTLCDGEGSRHSPTGPQGHSPTRNVRWFNDDKGYGRITADDGEVLFVHFSGIVADGFRSPDQGDRVTFTWNGGIVDHGRHVAENVRRGRL